jgi:hypothetical protein
MGGGGRRRTARARRHTCGHSGASADEAEADGDNVCVHRKRSAVCERLHEVGQLFFWRSKKWSGNAARCRRGCALTARAYRR